ncbi:mercuric reductase [Pseudorhodobacter sp.]|uniref:mercuric reductase n=1 Tax=Pseudorhodobacter sp. TaxID=1934400 RepID=UPI0026472720|nr:mercuric reductase [Pseudorhodobacter sp.]MDN5786332.1 mercuric reductase [Pseudorhodobacter sp.]
MDNPISEPASPTSFDHDPTDPRRELERNLRPANWQNPDPAKCYNLAVIGAGPAGLTAARIAARLGARVALIEAGAIGGDCTNIGCVPTKAIIRSGQVFSDMRHASHFGVHAPDTIFDPALALARVRKAQARISRMESADRLRSEGIDVFFGNGCFANRRSLRVGDQTIRFSRAIVATGGALRQPDVPGLQDIGYLTVETLFNRDTLPKSIMVIGGGPLGCEMAQALCRLGVRVVLIQNAPKFLPREERDAAQFLSESLARDGIEIHLNTTAVGARQTAQGKEIALTTGGDPFSITVDEVLTGVGRTPRIVGLGLEAAGVAADPETGIRVDDHMRTSNRRIFAAGDVCGGFMFTHVADAAARLAVRNALFFGRGRYSRLTIPWCTFTDPAIAHVGLYVDQAISQGIAVKTYTVLMHQVDRAVTDGEETGFVKIHVRQGTDRIIGATVVARHAGEMLNEITLAMQRRIGLRALSGVIHAYPTQSAAIKSAADACRADRLTPRLRRLSGWWMSLMRRAG